MLGFELNIVGDFEPSSHNSVNSYSNSFHQIFNKLAENVYIQDISVKFDIQQKFSRYFGIIALECWHWMKCKLILDLNSPAIMVSALFKSNRFHQISPNLQKMFISRISWPSFITSDIDTCTSGLWPLNYVKLAKLILFIF